ncbi:MAG: hypothetical protein ABSB09_08435 [Acidimicrobiales bacterium]
MRRGPILAWVAVGILVVTAVGAAVFGLVARTNQAAARLTTAMSATYDASGYTSVTSSEPGQESIVNSPDLYERIVGGVVSEIWVGDTIFDATPAGCAPGARFVERMPQGSASERFAGFGGDDVTEAGDTYTVTNNGSLLGRYVVRNGYVVSMTQFFRSMSGTGTESMSQSFRSIGHAPKIVVPTPDEVVVSPQVYVHGCPL